MLIPLCLGCKRSRVQIPAPRPLFRLEPRFTSKPRVPRQRRACLRQEIPAPQPFFERGIMAHIFHGPMNSTRRRSPTTRACALRARAKRPGRLRVRHSSALADWRIRPWRKDRRGSSRRPVRLRWILPRSSALRASGGGARGQFLGLIEGCLYQCVDSPMLGTVAQPRKAHLPDD